LSLPVGIVLLARVKFVLLQSEQNVAHVRYLMAVCL